MSASPTTKLSQEETERLSTAIANDDLELAATIIYRHLLLNYWDCRWCELEANFPTLASDDVEALLLYSQEVDNDSNKKGKKEDRYDFSVPRPDSVAAVRLRRGYSRSPAGIVAAVYCDRIYSYLVEQGCLENVGIAIEQVERDVPRPQQLNTTITLRTVLECDYRFDVIPFHKHGQMKETTRIVGVPACGFNATSSKNATKMPGTVCKARHGREDWLHNMPSRQKAPTPSYLTTTRMGDKTQGWTDVGTTVSAYAPPLSPSRQSLRQTTVGNVFCPDTSVFVYIRENPIYTFQFRGATNKEGIYSNSSNVSSNNDTGSLAEKSKERVRRSRRDPKDPSGATATAKATVLTSVVPTLPPVISTSYVPGICAAAGAIYRQRLASSSSVLVFRFHEYVGNSCDADYAAYLALRTGLQRCIENGFTPLILQSDNVNVLNHCYGGFVKTLRNYNQEDLYSGVKPMIIELIARNDFHQEALLAATTVKYLDKDKLRAERLAGVGYQPVASSDLRTEVLEDSRSGIDEGVIIGRGWSGNVY